MTDDTPEKPGTPAQRSDRGRPDPAARSNATDRDARLKAALRANLARRKAQTRARRAATDPED
jgi:hypothetical protein